MMRYPHLMLVLLGLSSFSLPADVSEDAARAIHSRLITLDSHVDIARMNQLGMMVDVSHSSEQCLLQTIKLSIAPIIASHSGVGAMADSARNLTDEQMIALADSGGVLQLVAYTGFIKPDPARDQVVYAINIMGIDHVGISSDFDGGGELRGWRDASESFNLTQELLTRGYNEEQISKNWGGNLLRV